MYNDRKNFSWGYIGLLVIIIIVLWFIESIIGADKYNNGICRNCGGTYVFQNAVGHHAITNYVYKCDKCGNLIEINIYYEE